MTKNSEKQRLCLTASGRNQNNLFLVLCQASFKLMTVTKCSTQPNQRPIVSTQSARNKTHGTWLQQIEFKFLKLLRFPFSVQKCFRTFRFYCFATRFSPQEVDKNIWKGINSLRPSSVSHSVFFFFCLLRRVREKEFRTKPILPSAYLLKPHSRKLNFVIFLWS